MPTLQTIIYSMFGPVAMDNKSVFETMESTSQSEVFAEDTLSVPPTPTAIKLLKAKLLNRYVAEIFCNDWLKAAFANQIRIPDGPTNGNPDLANLKANLMKRVQDYAQAHLDDLLQSAFVRPVGPYAADPGWASFLGVVKRMYETSGEPVQTRISDAKGVMVTIDSKIADLENTIAKQETWALDCHKSMRGDKSDKAKNIQAEMDRKVASMKVQYQAMFFLWLAIDLWRQSGKGFKLGVPVAQKSQAGIFTWKRS